MTREEFDRLLHGLIEDGFITWDEDDEGEARFTLTPKGAQYAKRNHDAESAAGKGEAPRDVPRLGRARRAAGAAG